MLGGTPESKLWWENGVTVTWARKAPCTTNMLNPLLDAARPQDPRNHAHAEAGSCQDSKEFQNRGKDDAPNSLIHVALAFSTDV